MTQTPYEPPTSSQPPQPDEPAGVGAARPAAPPVRKPPVRAQAPVPWLAQPPRPSWAKRILLGVLVLVLLLSLLVNVYLVVLLVALEGRAGLASDVVREGPSDQTIAVWRMTGAIFDDAARQFEAFSRQVMEDEDVKAVVIRVESPGGDVSSADQIHRRMLALKKSGRKVVVSMGGVAASGAYYVSAPADEIIAEPTTITGSIGVIMQWLVVKEGLDKLGIEMVTLKSRNAAEWKDEISPFRKPSPEQEAHLRELLDAVQARFEQIVKDGRGLKLKPLAAPPGGQAAYEALNGKIYLAEEAMAAGLVDSVGYQDDAIDRAARLAGLRKPRVVNYRRRRSLMERLAAGKARGGIELDTELIDRLQTPRVLLMWKAE
jgi:protease-4